MQTVLPASIVVDGATVTYGVSGTDGPDLVLMHGAGANHMWWHRIAPILEEHWRVIAIDLSGHGDSGQRDDYLAETWVEEISAVLDEVGSEHPVFAGHSMGSRVGMTFAAMVPDRLAGLIILDSAIRLPERFALDRIGRPDPVMRSYPSRDDILGRFRLKPVQPMPPVDVMDPVAQFSIREVADGWRWKHDFKTLHKIEDDFLEPLAARVRCPVGIIYGAQSGLVGREEVEATAAMFLGAVELVRIADAHHHLILDQPELCAAAIDAMASGFLLRPETA